MKFKFGAGNIQKANEQTVPGKIAGEDVIFLIYVIDNSDIPFLWGQKGMKKVGVKIDVAAEEITKFCKSIIHDVTTAGHVYISILIRKDREEGI